MIAHYIVQSVRGSGLGNLYTTQFETPSKLLENLGFEADRGYDRTNMSEGAVPRLLNIVLRYDTSLPNNDKNVFKLIRVTKQGNKPLLNELDAGLVLQYHAPSGVVHSGTITGKGRKLENWEITFETKHLDEHALVVKGDIHYSQGRIKPTPLIKAERSSIALPSKPTVVQDEPATETKAGQASTPPLVEKESAAEIPHSENGATHVNGHATLNPANADKEPPYKASEPVFDTLSQHVRTALTSEIMPDPDQPRTYFNESELHEIADSMKAESQVVLIIVRPISGVEGKKYMIIDGERRWRAAQYADIKELTVIVRPNVDNTKAFRQSVIANFNRAPHTVRESVNVIKRLLADGASIKEICVICGKPPCWYYTHMTLERLHPDLLKLVDPPTPKKSLLAGVLARKIALLPLDQQMTAHHQIVSEASARGRLDIADRLARPYMAESKRDKPSDHLRSLERYLLLLRGANRLNFRNAESAGRALVANRKAEQVEASIKDIDETITNLTKLRGIIEAEQKQCTKV